MAKHTLMLFSPIPPTPDDFAVLHNNGAHRHFTCRKGFFRKRKRLAHELFLRHKRAVFHGIIRHIFPYEYSVTIHITTNSTK